MVKQIDIITVANKKKRIDPKFELTAANPVNPDAACIRTNRLEA
jgi:hypothetical protein